MEKDGEGAGIERADERAIREEKGLRIGRALEGETESLADEAMGTVGPDQLRIRELLMRLSEDVAGRLQLLGNRPAS